MSNDRILRQIKARLSLRPPQADSLDILIDILEWIEFDKHADPVAALAAIQAPGRRSRTLSAISRLYASPWQPASARPGSWARLSAICISAAVRGISSCWPRTPRFTTS
jgi:hypothetical protein